MYIYHNAPMSLSNLDMASTASAGGLLSEKPLPSATDEVTWFIRLLRDAILQLQVGLRLPSLDMRPVRFMN